MNRIALATERGHVCPQLADGPGHVAVVGRPHDGGGLQVVRAVEERVAVGFAVGDGDGANLALFQGDALLKDAQPLLTNVSVHMRPGCWRAMSNQYVPDYAK